MKYRKITAIVNVNSLEAVEEALKRLETIEVAITRVKGYGDYKNFYSPEWISAQARVEVFAFAAQAEQVVKTIMQAAYLGLNSDGIVAVLPVEEIHRIRDHMTRPAS